MKKNVNLIDIDKNSIEDQLAAFIQWILNTRKCFTASTINLLMSHLQPSTSLWNTFLAHISTQAST